MASWRPPRGRRALTAGVLLVAAVALVLLLPTIGSARTEDKPSNIQEPKISGDAVQGKTLTTTTGEWTGNPYQFAYQWVHCPDDGGYGDGSNCDPIPGADQSSLLLQQSDVGHRIRVIVTATNVDGSANAASNPTDKVVSATPAPENTAEPKISGSAVKGQTLTATTGSWSNNPTSFAFQWLHCPPSGGKGDGSDCPAISGATGSSLVLQSSDVGFRIRVRVTATNAGGSASAASNPTATVTTAAAPVSTAVPVVSGQAVVAQTLVASTGTWTGAQPMTFSYQWLRCDRTGATCVTLPGATASTYVVATTDVGSTLRARVTAANPGGAAQALSNPTAVVAASSLAGCPAGTGAIPVASLQAPARLLLASQKVSPAVVRPGAGAIVVRYRVTACKGRPVVGALVYVTGVPYNQLRIPPEQATGADGWAQLQMTVLGGFPVSSKQRLLAMFVRARQPGGDLLGGISTRRLFAIRVGR
jgi:hypothetical protein